MGENSVLNQDAVLKVAPEAAPQTPEEGFILSRLTSPTCLKDLIPLCPWPEDQTMKVLQALFAKSALEIVGDKLEQQQERRSEERPEDPAHVQTLNDDENDPDLAWMDRKFRHEILAKFESLEGGNPYELLELRRHATAAEIKHHYLQLSRRFHPDRFFRKELGHYRAKLNLIFEKVQAAYDKIKNPHEREALDRTLKLKEQKDKPPSSPSTKRKSRKLDPMLERMGRADKHFKSGQSLLEQKQYRAAYNEFLLASQIIPNKKEYQEAIEQAKPYVNLESAEKELDRAKKAAEISMYDDMLRYAEAALKLNPGLGEASLYAAKAILSLGNKDRFSDAKEMLLRAKVSMPQSPEPCTTLARVLKELGDKNGAVRACEEALKRDSLYEPAQKLLQKLQ